MKMLRFGIQLCVLISRALVISRALIDADVLKDFKRSLRTRVIVEFEETKEHRSLRLTKNPKVLSNSDYEIFVKSLQRAASGVQGSALSHIAKSRISDNGEFEEYRAFTLWSSNELSIENADRGLLDALSEMPRVRKIRGDAPVPLSTSVPLARTERLDRKKYDRWHIKMIQADDVWKKGVDGKNVVVGIVDSGVHLEHDLLVTKWRKHYGWLDTTDRTEFPLDESWNGHGTGTAGVIVAGKQDSDRLALGVAPGATFIACRAVKNGTIAYGHVARCMNFMACPTDWRGRDADCTLRPRIINHSIGTASNQVNPTEFIVYEMAGITVTESAGNRGGNCSSLDSEGQNHWPITVGAVEVNRDRWNLSAAGPTADGRIKPDLMAPGEEVYIVANSIYSYDPSWGFFGLGTGTSVSAPIVAGIAALILSANPALEPADIKKIIQQTATWNVKRQIILCGNLPRDTRPNHVVGWGIANAYKAYLAALKVPCKAARGSTNVYNDNY